jgi:hypothetical protein
MLKVLLAKRIKKKSGYLKFSLIALICLLNSHFSLALAKDSRVASQMQGIKSAFIFNIAHYVTWQSLPQENNHPYINLCFLTRNPLGPAINSITNKPFLSLINQHAKKLPVSIHPQIIKSLKSGNNCQILYLTHEQVNWIAPNVSGSYDYAKCNKYSLLASKNLLVIADSSNSKLFENDLDPVTIYLFRQGARLGININHSALNKSNLKLSSQLLKLSKER